ncbi:MAG TPA: hypothetical protein VF522_08680 [Ramlibacter sp.]|uniref:hypothetical protein n=1 Tax=Ramlibacter sp. TaxID=1917967 RepID=UPI002ED3A395
MLFDERLLLLRLEGEEERLLPLALARSLLPLLELRLLDALARLLLLRDGDDLDGEDLDEEEELRDAMACSFLVAIAVNERI